MAATDQPPKRCGSGQVTNCQSMAENEEFWKSSDFQNFSQTRILAWIYCSLKTSQSPVFCPSVNCQLSPVDWLEEVHFTDATIFTKIFSHDSDSKGVVARVIRRKRRT